MSIENVSQFSVVTIPTPVEYNTKTEHLSLEQMIILCIWGSCMLLVGVIGNTIMLWIILKKPAMRSAINLLLASIAVTDLLLVNISLPFNILTLLHNRCFLSVICTSQSFILLVLLTHSALPLTAACLHRYMAYTFKRELFTGMKVCFFTIFTWIFSILFSIVPFITDETFFTWCSCSNQIQRIETNSSKLGYVILAFSITICIPFAIIVYSILHIQFCQENSGGSCSADTYSTIVTSLTPNNDVPVNNKSISTIMIISIIFLLTKSPLYIAQLIQYSRKVVIVDQIWLVWWTYMGAALNPLVYVVKVPKYRKTVRNCLPFLSGYYLLKRNRPRKNPKKLYEIKQAVHRIKSHGRVTPVNSTASIISFFSSDSQLNTEESLPAEKFPIISSKVYPFYNTSSKPISLPSVCVENDTGAFTQLNKHE